MARKAPQPQTPEQKKKTSAQLNIIGGLFVALLGVGLLLWGSPAEPGQRHNALWLALEEAMGYQGVCFVFIIGGALVAAWGLFKLMKLKRNPNTGA